MCKSVVNICAFSSSWTDFWGHFQLFTSKSIPLSFTDMASVDKPHILRFLSYVRKEEMNLGAISSQSYQASYWEETNMLPVSLWCWLVTATWSSPPFPSSLSSSSPGAKRLHTLMTKLKRWIKILELKTKSLQKWATGGENFAIRALTAHTCTYCLSETLVWQLEHSVHLCSACGRVNCEG